MGKATKDVARATTELVSVLLTGGFASATDGALSVYQVDPPLVYGAYG